MKNNWFIILFLGWASFAGQIAMAQEGMIAVKSAYDVTTTSDRLVNILGQKGMKVFARIDHAAGAASIGDALAPMELILFGNPKIGTGLMKCAPGTGIDLPMKALVWEADDGSTWLGYNDAEYLKSRHDLNGCDALIEKVKGALAKFANAATAP